MRQHWHLWPIDFLLILQKVKWHDDIIWQHSMISLPLCLKMPRLIWIYWVKLLEYVSVSSNLINFIQYSRINSSHKSNNTWDPIIELRKKPLNHLNFILLHIYSVKSAFIYKNITHRKIGSRSNGVPLLGKCAGKTLVYFLYSSFLLTQKEC